MSEYVTSAPDAAWWVAAVAACLLLGVLVWGLVRAVSAARTGLAQVPGSVRVAAVAAVACTAYSGDTSWRFAEHHLDMVNTVERAALFAAGELALFALALMARESVRQTTTPQQQGTAGLPGVLVWAVTGVQTVAAFAEGGLLGGLLRASFGPIGAALLWHIAMGIEIRHRRPGTTSQNLLAVLGRELRERLLSWLGVARRGRTAQQITWDRWTARAVDLAAHLEQLPAGARWRRGRVERRLSKAVGLSGVGSSLEQRRRLLEQLAARRSAAQLATITLASPWELRDPMAAGRSPSALAGAELRRLHPVDAVRAVAAAHPELDQPERDAELASLVTSLGVPVSAAQVGQAMHGVRAAARAALGASGGAATAGQEHVARLRKMVDVGPDGEPVQPQPTAPAVQPATPHEVQPEVQPQPATPDPVDDQDDDGPGLDPDPLLDQARALDDRVIAETGAPASQRRLQRELGVGQRRAQRIRQQLDRVAVDA